MKFSIDNDELPAPQSIQDKPHYSKDSTPQLKWLKQYLKLNEIQNMFADPNAFDINNVQHFISAIDNVMVNLARIVVDKKERDNTNKHNEINEKIQRINKKYKLLNNIDVLIQRMPYESTEQLRNLKDTINTTITKIKTRCNQNGFGR